MLSFRKLFVVLVMDFFAYAIKRIDRFWLFYLEEVFKQLIIR